MNFDNRTLFIADNLDIMRGMDSDTIDLIYLDPPFKSGKQWKAPIGSPAEGAEFKDIWTDEDIKAEWHGQIAAEHEELYQIIQASEVVYDKSMKIYLTAMAVRLFEMKRILKSTGSIYLHCDPTASHYLKTVMDDIFGMSNFRAEIIWKRHNAHNDKLFGAIHETIFYYSYSEKSIPDEVLIPLTDDRIKDFEGCDEHGKYESADLKGPGPSGGESGQPWKGIDPRNRHWTPPRIGSKGRYAEYIVKNFIPNYGEIEGVHDRLDALDKAGLILWPKRGKIPRLKRYLMPDAGMPPQSIWDDISTEKGEDTGYPTQKPLALLDRIIKASSKEKDIVLDPFCGCATACIAAERLRRNWVGIDISPDAEDITKLRLSDEVDKAANLFNPFTDVNVRKDAPQRTDNAEEIAVQLRLPTYQTHKPELFGMQQGRCNGCEYEFHYRNLTVDHIRPQSKGVDDRIENLQLLCASCNSIKGTGTHEELIQKLVDRKIRKVDGSTP